MAKLKLTDVEFGQLSHKLTRLAANKSNRTKDQQNLVQELSIKFNSNQLAYTDADGMLTVPLQRRHLRLLEEIQFFTLKILEESTIPELKSRLLQHPDKESYYKEKLQLVEVLKQQIFDLLKRIQELL